MTMKKSPLHALPPALPLLGLVLVGGFLRRGLLRLRRVLARRLPGKGEV